MKKQLIKENNEIIGTIDNNLTEHLINYSNNEDIIDKESYIIEFEKKNKKMKVQKIEMMRGKNNQMISEMKIII